MSLASTSSIARCTSIGTPLASCSAPGRLADDLDRETAAARPGRASPISAGAVHHVVDAGQRRDRRVGQRDEADVQRFDPVWVACLAMRAITGGPTVADPPWHE